MHNSSLRVSVLVLGAFAWSARAEVIPNRVLVKLRARPTLDFAQAFEGSSRVMGASEVLLQMSHGLSVVRYSTGADPREAARALLSDPEVEWAQPDYVLRAFPQPSVPELRLASGLESLAKLSASALAASKPSLVQAPALPATPEADPRVSEAWGLGKIEAPAAWEISGGSKRVIVADIDTGIDYTHEDLVNNLWEGVGYDFVANDNLPFDDNEHGTHTAGTIGATGGNGKGVAGVSPRVSLMALKFLSGEGIGSTSDAVRAIDFAIEHGARVMSNSWGGRSDDAEENRALEDAVARADKADVLFVAASGNDGTDNDNDPVYPAAIKLPNMLTVASTQTRDGMSYFSNYGATTVHVAAPGSNILSTTPGNTYQKLSGTSMACPHVAGLAALILSVRPELHATQVKQIIMDSVDPVASLNSKTVSGGRVNARAALERAKTFGI